MLKAFFKRIITEVIKELISPELASIRAEIKGVETSLGERIDKVEVGLRGEIKRVETSLGERIDKVEIGLRGEIKRVEVTLNQRVDRFEERLDRFDEKLDRINKRLDDLYLIVVRRDEHTSLEDDVKRLREDVDILKRRVGI